MKVIYIDSSILVGILFNEKNSLKWQRHLKSREEVVSSFLAEAELFSAAAREKADLKLAEELLQFVSFVQPDRSLKKEYQKIFSLGYVRGADACHLATALYLDPEAKVIEFLTADSRQRQIAKELGFHTPF